MWNMYPMSATNSPTFTNHVPVHRVARRRKLRSDVLRDNSRVTRPPQTFFVADALCVSELPSNTTRVVGNVVTEVLVPIRGQLDTRRRRRNGL